MARSRRREEIERQRRTLDRVLDRQTIRPMRSTFESEASSVVRELSRSVRGRRRPATAGDIAQIAGRAERQVARMYRPLSEELVTSSNLTMRAGLRSMGRFTARVGDVSASMINVDEVVGRRLERIEAAREAAVERLARHASRDVRRRIMMATAGAESVADVVDRAGEAIDQQFNAVVRLSRNEASAAFNQARADGIRVLARDDRRIMKRWTEMVDDVTGRPMDNRVGIDSIVLHGQVQPSGNAFKMPPDPRAPAKMRGKEWAHPPNRPNDRAILLPWMPEWGIPGWQWRGGGRRNVRTPR